MPPKNRWTYHPTLTDGTDINCGIVDDGALLCCDYCDKKVEKGGRRCAHCKEALYCSLECEKDDRFHHNLLCGSAEGKYKIASRIRPKNFVRALLLDLGGEVPEFVLLDKDNFPKSVAEVFSLLVEEVLPPVSINDRIPHRRLNHGIQLYFPGAIHREANQWADEFNRCTTLLSRPGLSRFHYTSFLFCAFRTSPSGDYISFENMTMKDYRAVIDFFQICTHPLSVIVNLPRYPRRYRSYPGREVQAWPAVKVNCEGDIKRLNNLTNECWSPVEDILVTSRNNASYRKPTFLAALAGLPWMTEFVYFDDLTPIERKNYGGRIFANKLVEGPNGERVLAAEPNCGTFYVMNHDGSPIHPDHILAFYDFAESQLKGIMETEPPGCRVAVEFTSNIIYAPIDELRKWFTRKRFEAYWLRWIGQPERRMSYKHNDCGDFWYPLQNFYSRSMAWDPYVSVKETAKEGIKESDKKGDVKKGTEKSTGDTNGDYVGADYVDQLHKALADNFKALMKKTLW
ncbi:hypothetical protein GGS26DRAFT_599034 [Hypomontagnella submonticulosa]|nr:hypothetical protein GGS26DRAFT_599034 [Hypomontagnella submonticulosa]